MTINELNNVPHLPGVYLWKDKFDNIIYVGKAKDLQNRMKQYFKGMQNSYKTQKLVTLIEKFDYVITNSDKEALILERNLIEKHSPEFNILLTDDKKYPYIKVVLRDRLEIYMIYRIKSDRERAVFFGPFPTGYGARKLLNLLTRIALYKDGLPVRDLAKDEWARRYDNIKKMLTSNKTSLLQELKLQLNAAVENFQFEIAQDVKETIDALSFYVDKQSVELGTHEDIDVGAFLQNDNYVSIAMLFYRQGLLLSKKEMVIEIVNSFEETVRQFVAQYYSFNIKPNYIISNVDIESDQKVLIPKKGRQKQILEMALQNAQNNIELKMKEFIRHEELTIGAVKELQELLGLENINHILMVDNSTTNNTDPVSVFVSYRNGQKNYSEYRKYKVETFDRLADVDYMRQGVTKYFANKENAIPDLLIVDGGIAQINEIKKIVQLPIIGLVKNEYHTTEFLIDLKGNKIKLQSGNLLNFLKGVQFEVDRYAKSIHSSKRKITTLEGKLIGIPGIGNKIEQKLLSHFKTYSAIYNASLEELSSVVPVKIAILIKKEMEKND